MPTLDEMLSTASSLHRARLCRTAARHSFSTVAARAPQVTEKHKEYKITVSAPGVKASDLKLYIEEEDDTRMLAMRGETKTPTHTHCINWATNLPRDADVEKATATHVDGLLEVTIPKKVSAKSTIAILANCETTPDDADDDSHYTMRLNCAGIAKADLDLTIEDDLLTVTGETKSRGAWLCPRTYRLPRDADGTKASASYVDGILTIAVEKKPTAEPKKIELTVANALEKGAEEEHGDAEKTEEAMDAEEEAVVV